MTKTGVIGVLGTKATVRQPYVDDLSATFGRTVLRHGGPDWLPRRKRSCAARFDPAAIDRAIAGLRDQPGGDALDVIVLACTHFRCCDELQAAAGPQVRLIDGAAGIARRIAYLTQGQAWPAAAQPGVAVFTRSDEREPPPLSALAPMASDALRQFDLSAANRSHWISACFAVIATSIIAAGGSGPRAWTGT
jgi:glutamate racemase